jgi:hypothetical protein
MPFHQSFSTVAAALDYDPDTGALIWKRQYGKRIQIGAPAGTVNRYGDHIVTLYGQNYPAKHVAWLLAYGHWPALPVTFRSLATAKTPEERAAARLDLRLSNLCVHAPPRVANSRADYMRERRARLKAEAADAPRVIDGYPSIVWSHTSSLWVVREDEALARAINATRQNHELGRTPNTIAAIEMFNEHNNRCRYLLDNPPPDLLPHEAAISTNKGHTLEELTQHMLYNPDTGEFIARHGNRAGMIIDRPKDLADPHGTRVVPYQTSTYYARNLAWFLHHYEWPAPRQIRHADPTARDDNSMSNIIPSTAP